MQEEWERQVESRRWTWDRNGQPIASLECSCTVLKCMNSEPIAIICPKHSGMRQALLDAEYKKEATLIKVE